MAKVIETHIGQLTPDDHNFNKGTEYGQHLMEESLRKFGGGRSVLIDKNNRIIAGNKTIETAGQIGMERVVVVETTGNEIVAVKRTDIDLDTAKGREMALADNMTGQKNFDMNVEELDMMAEQFDFDPGDWGVNIETPELEMDDDGHKDLSNNVESLFQIAIDCENEQEQERIYNELKDRYKCRVLTL